MGILLPILLDPSSSEPFYKQITDQVRNLILSGRLESGTALPSVRGLAQQLSVSVITTRKAYDELEYQGLIMTRPGMGSYVASQGGEKLEEARIAHIRALMEDVVCEALRVGMSPKQIRELADQLLDHQGDE